MAPAARCAAIAVLIAHALSCGSAKAPEPTSASPGRPAAPVAGEGAAVGDPAPGAGNDEAAAPAPSGPAAAARSDDRRPRIGALGPHTWIYKVAAFRRPAIGKMRIGTSVALRSTTPIRGDGCPKGWYAVEPRGYVCHDETATLDLESPYYRALQFSAPDPGLWPYRYAHSDGAPMYSRVPTPAEWESAERGYGEKGFRPLGQWAIGHEELISGEPIRATDPVPWFLEGGKRRVPGGNYNAAVLVWKKIPAGSMLSYSRAFEMHGRVWLLTPETMVVPADRVSDMRRSTFRGVHFDGKSDVRLPLAWNRSKEPLPKYRREADGSFVATDQRIAPKTPVEIGDEEISRGEMVFMELRREPGLFVGKPTARSQQLDGPVSVTRRVTKLPRSIPPGAKWIQVKIVPGTLTAYIGDEPVLATLFSPGKGGPPVPGNDHEKYATTATGYFPIEWKERVATMSNEPGEPKVLWFTDVPHQQYLKAPLAMHVAYWHEDFGKRKSAECVNVSPSDGQFLFGWTDPPIPEGWNGVGPGNGFGKSTPVIVTIH